MTAVAATPARSAAIPLVAIVIGGCIIAAVSNGVRTSFGLFTLPVTTDLHISREAWGMAFAIQNLAWGIAQPFAGAFADRYGTGRTVVAGLLLYALGCVLMTISPDAGTMTLTAGVVTGVAVGIASFSVVMQAFGRSVPPEKRSLYFGVATAASSFGQFAIAPLGQGLITAFGWQQALLYLACTLIAVIPLAYLLKGRTEAAAGQAEMDAVTALRQAFRHRSYRLLVTGFFVCCFHLAFINVHMPAYLVQCGLNPAVGSWSIAIIGLFNIVGSLGSGYVGSRFPKQILLASIYFTRAVAIGLFLLFPVSELSAYVFSAAIGLLWLSTVPPTAGLVSTFFGARYMGLLYGIAFLSHQVGSFMGVWLGGLAYDTTGSYALVWYLGILLGLGSAAVHLPIREAGASGFQARAALA
jgi:predicted MFS family arabinose efflux permease